jgi:hypothetical protein
VSCRHHDLEVSGLDGSRHVDSMEGEVLGNDLERDGPRLTRADADPAEAAELLQRARGRTDSVTDDIWMISSPARLTVLGQFRQQLIISICGNRSHPRRRG